MPKLINYSDRFEAVREVVYEITLEEGVEAVTLDSVAARLVMSTRTLSRLISSIDVLPLLGLQHAESRERRRLIARTRVSTWISLPPSEQALDDLLGQLPDRDDAPDMRAWWLLVRAHAATTEWAGAALAEREHTIAVLSADALEGVTPEGAREAEARRLHFLVSGAIAQICLGTVDRADAEACIDGHVRSVLAGSRAADAA